MIAKASDLKDIKFEFTKQNLAKAKHSITKYPKERKASAVLELLYIAQEQNSNWLSRDALDYVADFLEMPRIRVYEVASFYTMFNLSPVGKYHLQVCGTTPCWLRGAGDIIKTCEKKLGIKVGETTKDGLFTLSEVECLGACANAPMMQINNELYYEDLTVEHTESLLKNLALGKDVKSGSQIGRSCSEPFSGSGDTNHDFIKKKVDIVVNKPKKPLSKNKEVISATTKKQAAKTQSAKK
jgi:NADH dehydrogenase (ubiquinone) flavoprotein 2